MEIARYIRRETCISDVTLPAMSFRDSFCVSRKGRTEGGGWVHLKGADSMAVSGFGLEMLLVKPGGPLIFCPLHKWAEKTVI